MQFSLSSGNSHNYTQFTWSISVALHHEKQLWRQQKGSQNATHVGGSAISSKESSAVSVPSNTNCSNSDHLKDKQILLYVGTEVFTCHTRFFQFKLQVVYFGKQMQGRYWVYYSLFVSFNQIQVFLWGKGWKYGGVYSFKEERPLNRIKERTEHTLWKSAYNKCFLDTSKKTKTKFTVTHYCFVLSPMLTTTAIPKLWVRPLLKASKLLLVVNIDRYYKKKPQQNNTIRQRTGKLFSICSCPNRRIYLKQR